MTKLSLPEQRDKWLKEVEEELSRMPGRPSLDLKILYKRKFYGYEEWKIEYTAQKPDKMSFLAGQVIPAYLLIPTEKRCIETDERPPKPPFPAIVCFHQCNVDCDIGKEAVVGKVVDRPDQAYGLELVRRGFVVLAPDTIWCGERFVVPGRREGERVFCLNGLNHQPIYQELYPCQFDGLRAVDVLESLEFVDRQSIGAIGHSGGGFWTIKTMVYDQRVKIGVTSGWVPAVKDLACIAPRPLMQLFGLKDNKEEIEKIKRVHESGRIFYQEWHAGSKLVLRLLPCGHEFVDEFKQEAYARLVEALGYQLRPADASKATRLTHTATTCNLEL